MVNSLSPHHTLSFAPCPSLLVPCAARNSFLCLRFGNLPITVAAKSGALEVCRYLVQSARMNLHSVTDPTLLQDLLQTVLNVCPVQLPAKAQLRPPKKR